MPANNKSFIFVTFLTLGLFFSGLFVVFTPLPLIYYQLKNRDVSFARVVWPTLAVVLAIYGFGVNFFYQLYQSKPLITWFFPVPMVDLLDFFNQSTVRLIGISYFGLYAGMSFLIAHAFKETQNKAFKTLFFSVIGLFVVGGCFAFVMVYPKSDAILTSYRTYMQMGFDQFIAAQEQAGMALDQITLLKTHMGDFINHFFFMLPFIFLGTLTFLFILNLLVAKRFFTVFFKDLKNIQLTEFRAPFELVWTVIGFGSLMVVNKFIWQRDPVYYTLLNLLLCVAVVYFLQGMAVFFHFLGRKKINGWLRFPFYLFLFMMFEASLLLLTALGFFENWLDTRKLEIKAKAAKA